MFKITTSINMENISHLYLQISSFYVLCLRGITKEYLDIFTCVISNEFIINSSIKYTYIQPVIITQH